MYLSIIISRLSNFLFFVQKTNRDNLDKFDLRKSLINKHLDIFFYGKNENEIWKQINKSIGAQNIRHFQSAITPLKPIFASHWSKIHKQLLLWKQYFQNNQPLFQQTIIELKKLSGIKHFAVSKIPIYLISNLNSENNEIDARFSWTPKESFIAIEIPFNLKVPNHFFPVSILAHEFFHLMLRKNKNLIFEINKIAKKNERVFTKLSEGIPNRIFLEELIISSFIPEGYLSKKCLNTKFSAFTSKPKDLLSWRKIVASKSYEIAKNYINNIGQIDKKYLEHIVNVLKQNTK